MKALNKKTVKFKDKKYLFSYKINYIKFFNNFKTTNLEVNKY